MVEHQQTSEDKKVIKDLLEDSSSARRVEGIRKELGVSNWHTVLKHCLELRMNEDIGGKKTDDGWVFWLEGDEDE